MENGENRDGDDVVTSSRDIRNDGGNVQAPGEIMGVGNYDSNSNDNGEGVTTNVRREEILNNGVGGGSRQRNSEDDITNMETKMESPEEKRIGRMRSLSEADAVRPPPLDLSSINISNPTIEEERVGETSTIPGVACDYTLPSSGSNYQKNDAFSISNPEQEGCSSRAAHVDVNIFRYQPGVMGPPENLKNYKISVRGAALLGGMLEDGHCQSNSFALTGTMDIASEYEKRKGMHVMRYHIKDHRAKQLLVVPSNDKFMALAAPEAFSRHSGTCMILGGQGAYTSKTSRSYKLKLGHFLRIGSVGVVVSEIHTGVPGEHKCLSWEELTCLKGDIAAIQKDLVTKEALTAREEGSQERASRCLRKKQNCSVVRGNGNNGEAEGSDDDDNSISSSSDSTVPVDRISCHSAVDGSNIESSSSYPQLRKMCYMCFDDVDTENNPLLAPCKCLGDTRYVHIDCLQKWHTTSANSKVCVVLNNKGVRICTVCKTPYKPSVRLANGEVVSLFQSPLPPPYICFMVVTKHLNNEDLFSTKYQLSFASVLNRAGSAAFRSLLIGRSRSCDMVLDYRTVSTKHAEVRFSGGNFYFTDTMSSNGSYLYVREPLILPYGETVYLKWGSNVVSLKAKRSIRHRLGSLVGRRSLTNSGKGKNDNALSILESLCDASKMNL